MVRVYPSQLIKVVILLAVPQLVQAGLVLLYFLLGFL